MTLKSSQNRLIEEPEAIEQSATKGPLTVKS